VTWYELWLFVHISGVAIWIGGGVVAQVFGALAKASGDPARSAAYGKDMGSVGPWVFMPASLVVLASGILLVVNGNWDWSETFIVLGLVGWAVVSFTFFGYVGMRMAAEGPSPALGAEVGRLVLLARVMILVLFALVFVMVVKPGT
jgi:uncharacterized membrane protein